MKDTVPVEWGYDRSEWTLASRGTSCLVNSPSRVHTFARSLSSSRCVQTAGAWPFVTYLSLGVRVSASSLGWVPKLPLLPNHLVTVSRLYHDVSIFTF